MSKEEIMFKYHTHFDESDLEMIWREEGVKKCMTEYADQESEKRAVAFAEWKDRNTAISELGGYFLTSTNVPIYFKRLYKDSSDLYQYWLTNVKNK